MNGEMFPIDVGNPIRQQGVVDVGIKIESSSDFTEQRRTRRQGVQMDCTVRERSRSAVPAAINDFSASGVGIKSNGVPLAGNQIWVRLNGLESLSGRVAWSNGSTAGVEFERPLHAAVALRFEPGVKREALTHPPLDQSSENVVELDPLLSRREQIMQGVSGSDLSPLKRRKQKTGAGILGSISRTIARKSDHRHELRFRDATTTGQMALKISAQTARVEDVSSSGLRVRTDLIADIGAELQIEFDGFEAIAGKLIWQGMGEIGISLPPESIDLHSNQG